VVADGNERRRAGQMKVLGVRQERANECPVLSVAQRLNDEAQGANEGELTVFQQWKVVLRTVKEVNI